MSNEMSNKISNDLAGMIVIFYLNISIFIIASAVGAQVSNKRLEARLKNIQSNIVTIEQALRLEIIRR